jgi:hypothetical protein
MLRCRSLKIRVAFLHRDGEHLVTNHPTFLNLNGPTAFEPEITHAMGVAFDEVCRALFVSDNARVVREAIAEKIIENARRGERDPQRLRDAVLKQIGVADHMELPCRQSA